MSRAREALGRARLAALEADARDAVAAREADAQRARADCDECDVRSAHISPELAITPPSGAISDLSALRNLV